MKNSRINLMSFFLASGISLLSVCTVRADGLASREIEGTEFQSQQRNRGQTAQLPTAVELLSEDVKEDLHDLALTALDNKKCRTFITSKSGRNEDEIKENLKWFRSRIQWDIPSSPAPGQKSFRIAWTEKHPSGDLFFKFSSYFTEIMLDKDLRNPFPRDPSDRDYPATYKGSFIATYLLDPVVTPAMCLKPEKVLRLFGYVNLFHEYTHALLGNNFSHGKSEQERFEWEDALFNEKECIHAPFQKVTGEKYGQRVLLRNRGDGMFNCSWSKLDRSLIESWLQKLKPRF